MEYLAHSFKRLLDSLLLTNNSIKILNTDLTYLPEKKQNIIVEIRQKGIYLYSTSDKGLPEPKHPTNDIQLPIAQEHFDQWFESAGEFLGYFKTGLEKQQFKSTAFHQLHQSVERYYNCILLVTSSYQPRGTIFTTFEIWRGIRPFPIRQFLKYSPTKINFNAAVLNY